MEGKIVLRTNFDEDYKEDPNAIKSMSLDIAVPISYSMLNETLDWKGIVLAKDIINRGGGYIKNSLNYALTDNIAVGCTYINYWSGYSAIFNSSKDNDKVLLETVFSF